MLIRDCCLPVLFCLAYSAVSSGADTVDFDHDVRPILNDHCAGCHGGVKKNGGFSVISRELLLSETDSGTAAVIVGDASGSPMLHRIEAADPDERMPPEGHDELSAREIRILRQWIDAGAQWPSHWAYGTLPSLPPPEQFGGQHPVDWYVRKKLAARGISPSKPADAATLVRRLALDLTGLLPEPEVAGHLGQSPDAFESDSQVLQTFIDGFLASPHFGERWARHWLDEARYADSEGYEKDSAKEDAYQFRDWVIRVINEDMPFSEFTRSQIAGDLLPNPTPDDLIATKFHLQTQFNLEGGVDSEEDRTKRVIDRVGTVGSVWLGSSIACCQCHDHPYDSFRQRDFYRLYAFFNNTDVAADFFGTLPEDAEKKKAERQKNLEELQALLEKQVDDKNLSDQTQSLLSRMRSNDNSQGFTRYLKERTASARSTYVFTRGDFQRPMIDAGPVVADVPGQFGTLAESSTSPSRLDLANWLVHQNAALTARVTVNKVWMHLFGQPLADQPQEFGSRGSAPSHPELLNYLSRWFVDEAGWSRKKLIRLIVTSETYQQSSRTRSELVSIDPGNRLLARQNRFRVEAEIVRDISLQAAGLLSRTIGGKSVFPPLPAIIAQQTYANSNRYKASEGEDRYRRGVYTFFRRTAIDPNLSTFDCPDSSLTRAQRDRSNNPLQALATMHNEVFHESAQAFAKRVLKSDGPSDIERLQHAFQITLGREAVASELQPLTRLLAASRHHYQGADSEAVKLIGGHGVEGVAPVEQAAWISVMRVVLNLDEFLTRA